MIIEVGKIHICQFFEEIHCLKIVAIVFGAKLSLVLNDLSSSTKTKLGRQQQRPKLKTNTIFSMFEEYFFIYVSASFQRHLAGTPSLHTDFKWYYYD